MNRLVPLIITSMMLISCASSNRDADYENRYANHRIVGNWSMERSGCEEVFSFYANGERHIKSYQQTGIALFEIDAEKLPNGLERMTDTIIEDNQKPDCTGTYTNQIGEEVVLYTRLHPQIDEIYFCYDPEGRQCFGPFYKKFKNRVFENVQKSYISFYMIQMKPFVMNKLADSGASPTASTTQSQANRILKRMAICQYTAAQHYPDDYWERAIMPVANGVDLLQNNEDFSEFLKSEVARGYITNHDALALVKKSSQFFESCIKF